MRRLYRLLKAMAVLGILVGLLYGTLCVMEGRGYFDRRISEEFGRYVGGLIDVGSSRLNLLERTLEAEDLSLRLKAGDDACVSVPEMKFHLPLALPDDGPYIPDLIVVKNPFMVMVEAADGSLSPIDLIKPWVPTQFVPAVSISDGSVVLKGVGPLNQLLDRLLKPGSELERWVEGVNVATFPEQLPSPDVFGIGGSLQLRGISEVSVSGGLGRDNSFRLSAEVAALDLSEQHLLNALNPQLSRRVSEHLVRGKANVNFAFSTPPSEALGGEPGELYARLSLSDLDLRFPYFDTVFKGASGTASFDGRSLFVHDFWVPDGRERMRIDGVLDDVFEDSGWRLTLRAETLRLEGQAAGALSWEPVKRAIMDFSPRGTYRFFAEVSRHPVQEPVIRWRVEPKQANASFVSHRSDGDPPEKGFGFPYRLFDLTGTVSGVDRHVEIRDVKGRHNGGGLASVGGWVEIPEGRHSDYVVNVAADDAPIDDDLKNALETASPGSRALLDRFRPEGSVNLDVTAWRGPDDAAGHIRGVVESNGGSCLFDEVPLPLERVAGRVEFEDDEYRIVGVSGWYGDAKITVDGKVRADGDQIGLDLSVSARDVPLNDRQIWEVLGEFLPNEDGSGRFGGGPALMTMLSPNGTADFDVKLEQQLGGELRFRALVYPRGVEILPTWFPVPIKGVIGKITLGNLHPGDPDDRRYQMRFDRLEGLYRQTAILGWGQFGEGIETSLHVRGDRVALSNEIIVELGEAVRNRAEEKGPELARILEDLHAEGNVSFHYRLGEAANRVAVGENPRGGLLDLVLKGVDAHAAVLPGESVHNLRGTVRFDFAGDRIEVHELRGELAADLGEIRSKSVTMEMVERGVRLTGDAVFDQLPFGPPLALLLPKRLGCFFEQGITSGSLAAELKRVELEIGWPSAEGRPKLESISFDGLVNLEQCEINRPVSLRGIDAKLDVSGSGSLSGTPSVRFTGRLRDLGGRLGAIQLSGLEADLIVDERSVELNRISGKFLSGDLREELNQVRVGFGGEESQVSGHLEFENADLSALLTRLGQSQRGVGGKVSLVFDFDGDASSPASLKGTGLVEIVDGQIWELPVLATLYTASLGLVFGSKGKPTFDSGIIEFQLSHGKLIVDRFELNAPVASTPVGLMLTGRGVLGPTGVDLRVVPRIIAVNVPILSPAIDLLKRGLLNYRIYGPLANPRIAYWNAAADVMSPNQDVTRLPRLAPRIAMDWDRRF